MLENKEMLKLTYDHSS